MPKPSPQQLLKTMVELLNNMDDVTVTHARCSAELYSISLKVQSFRSLHLLNYFAEYANFRFNSWSIHNPYHPEAIENPANQLAHCIDIKSHTPGNNEARFTLKTLGQLILTHQRGYCPIGDLADDEAMQIWLYDDDE